MTALNTQRQFILPTRPSKVGDIIAEAHSLPRFDYIEAFTLLPDPSKILRHNTTASLPDSIPESFRDIYTVLLDFYSHSELEAFRKEFGDHILWQLYHDEISPLYFR